MRENNLRVETRFGSDVKLESFTIKILHLWTLTFFDFEMLFGAKPELEKADRLRYGDSMMTHAMLFSAVQVEDDKTVQWRVENSWGKSGGKGDGYLLMTDKWFDEYNFQVAIDRKHLSGEVLSVLEQEPHVLPVWDPMGTLATSSSIEDFQMRSSHL
eukprot:TRINITY_DN3646_c0_g1_i1.p2 TRINITY_DN3646_c0_g1~~TRINITY_DN3646_c0_g1_i1.p2  ORF type:complete len:157 (+),score=37.38 TRINITY_DN3646_c0_g1_i1:646-1116(+)